MAKKNNNWILIVLIVIGMFLISGCGSSVCNSKLDACDYSQRPAVCSNSLEEATTFCKTLGSSCQAYQEGSTWKCSCPSECSFSVWSVY